MREEISGHRTIGIYTHMSKGESKCVRREHLEGQKRRLLGLFAKFFRCEEHTEEYCLRSLGSWKPVCVLTQENNIMEPAVKTTNKKTH